MAFGGLRKFPAFYAVPNGGERAPAPRFLGPAAGGARLLVFNSYRLCQWWNPDCDGQGDEPRVFAERLWRIAGDRLVAIGKGPSSYEPVDVDGNRIVVAMARGTVRVLDARGRLVRSFSFRDATSAQLSGNDLVVVRDDTLEVWDLATGQRRPSYPLERGFGPVPVVEDAEQGIATVVIGVAIHLIRLADGKDVVLDIPNQAGPSHAELEPSGLFYSWNEPYTRKPGRLAFLPWEDVVAAFG